MSAYFILKTKYEIEEVTVNREWCYFSVSKILQNVFPNENCYALNSNTMLGYDIVNYDDFQNHNSQRALFFDFLDYLNGQRCDLVSLFVADYNITFAENVAQSVDYTVETIKLGDAFYSDNHFSFERDKIYIFKK